jgi:hypothetical protein
VAAAKQRTLHLLSGRGAPMAVDPAVGDNQIVAVQHIMDGVLLAVDVAVPAAGRHIADAEARLAAFVSGATFQTERGSNRISEQDEIVRLVVVHGLDAMTFFRGEDDLPVSWLLAETLRWIMTQAERPDDLAMFLRASQGTLAERAFSFGPFDMWEYWSSNGGAFHRRGQPLTAMFFSAHSERAEWHWHAERAWIEVGLLDVGLPRLASWPVVIGSDTSRMIHLIDRPRSDGVYLIRSTDEQTVTAIRYDPKDDATLTLETIAEALCWKVRNLDDDMALIAHEHDVRFELQRGQTSLAVERQGGVIVIAVGEDLAEELAVDSDVVEDAIGVGIASQVEPNRQASFLDAWRAAPPTIAVDQVSVPQVATGLPDLRGPHPSLVSEADQAVAERLYRGGIDPGVRHSVAARDLESATIYPVVLQHLHGCFEGFDPDRLVEELLVDLECSMASRWREEGDHARRFSLARARQRDSVDYVAKVAESRSDRTILSRIVMLCIE